MLKRTGKCDVSSSRLPNLAKLSPPPLHTTLHSIPKIRGIKLSTQEQVSNIRCRARRRVRYEEDDDEKEDDGYGYNEEIALLENYTQSAREEVLLVHAIVDDQEVEVLIFKVSSSKLLLLLLGNL